MNQRGFTLLELMVAMAIFAMLAVAGWQVFDSVTRARERAQYHADQLAVLQYAYLQLQQDMAQIVPYQAPLEQVGNNNPINNALENNNSSNNNTFDNNQDDAGPFISVSSESISFVRFADPDPRYQNSLTLQRIDYVFSDQRLIRRQYHDLQSNMQSISLDSVLLDGVTATNWHAYLPEISATFPSKDSHSSVNDSALPDSALLPKGIGVNFTYQDIPISWQWALTPQPIPYQRQTNKKHNSANHQPSDNKDNNNSNDFDINSESTNEGDNNNRANGRIDL